MAGDKNIAECRYDFFVSVGRSVAGEVLNRPRGPAYFLKGDFAESFFISPTTLYLVNTIINSLQNKAGSLNTFSTKVLKFLSPLISAPLSVIINKSFSRGVVPDTMKIARVVPIKKPSEPTDMNNYRPISILPATSKIYEKIMHKQPYSYLCNKSILFRSQFGFRKIISTIHAIINHVQYLCESIDAGNIVISLFLDFRKAFDSIDHKLLLDKLSFHRVRGTALEWFQLNLTNISQFTIIGQAASGVREVTHGVPQESILGLLLFLIYINDLPNFSTLFKYILYADYCTLSVSFPPTDIFCHANIINSELKNVDAWPSANKIIINDTKSNDLLFSYRIIYDISPIKIKIGLFEIKPANSTTLLGIFIDRNLTFLGSCTLYIVKCI